MVPIVFNHANWASTKLILRRRTCGIPVVIYVEHPWRPRRDPKSTARPPGALLHPRDTNRDWLIDAGLARITTARVAGILRSRGVDRLAGLILTHGDAAHLGGAGGVLLDFVRAN